MDALRGQVDQTIAINNACQLAPWADHLYACDYRWWRHYKHLWVSFAGKKWTQDKRAAKEFDLQYIQSRPARGLSETWDYINQGANSGYQALNLAYLMGASEIYMLGYDMGIQSQKTHFFGAHPGALEMTHRTNFANWISYFDEAALQLTENGVKVYNCTRTTALTCFERLSLGNSLC